MGVDFDEKYIAITQELLQDKFEGEVNFDLMCVDVSKWNTEKMRGFFDVVVMNPPFGTKEQGMDYIFLTKAFEICKGNVYSFHKTCTSEVRFLMKWLKYMVFGSFCRKKRQNIKKNSRCWKPSGTR